MEGDDAGATKRPPIWDCGSSLYDSFELEALKRQLDLAIVGRTYSMPRLPSDPPPPPQRAPRNPSRISRSMHRLLRAVQLFRPGVVPAPAAPPHGSDSKMGRGCHGVYPHSGALGVIPEAPAKGVAPAEQRGPAVRKTASERYTVAAVRVYCH